MIRPLRLAQRSAVKARTQAANQLNALLVTAPDGLRASFRSRPARLAGSPKTGPGNKAI
jgi:transposase